MLGDGAQQSLKLGQLGSDYINDTLLRSGAWGILFALTDCTFTSLTSGYGVDNEPVTRNNLDGLALGKGLSICGYFTSIRLSAGALMAYRIRASGVATNVELTGSDSINVIGGEGGDIMSGEGASVFIKGEK